MSYRSLACSGDNDGTIHWGLYNKLFTDGFQALHADEYFAHFISMQATRNCLVDENNNVKVADYSLALYTSPRKPSRTVVSIKWAAPELIVQQPMFTTKSDVWSFGKALFGILDLYHNHKGVEALIVLWNFHVHEQSTNHISLIKQA